eukprot:CAMPEP_0113528804 /NCGR_PEP_ID=MMETSP0015_2-20120614/2045_1 /TAXON_ID=2838 /ORGANISM="Odontella" /LENGTH=119 /DNA_ID=CAMNT_0000427371 /DNA_START=192 /DNA_END=551 /DNA_ORIENTATION=- /assembly_acc=CAM_ASM_000160
MGLCWFLTMFKVVKTMSDLQKVCQQYSESDSGNNGFRYTLHSEYWGGCNKVYAKRYFIIVYVPSGTGDGNNSDIEQPIAVTPVAAPAKNDVFQDDPSSVVVTSGDGGTGPSIFDQLSGH